MAQDTDITFITTTQFTTSLKYCKAFVKKFFPTSQHIIIDGRWGWPSSWFLWIKWLSKITTKYFILVDEDCFVTNNSEIKAAIEELERTKATLAGVPDDFFGHRHFNGVAINPFFVIGNRERLLNVLTNNPEWPSLKFKLTYLAKIPNLPPNYEPEHPDFEFFYGLFWAILEAKETFLYLKPEDNFEFADDKRQNAATNVKLTGAGPVLAIHLWYSRVCQEPEHNLRYQKFEAFAKSIDCLWTTEKRV